MFSLLTLFLLASPYPFEVKTGFVAEPTLGVLFQDNIDKEKITTGIRLSYLKPDLTDTLITAEISATAATALGRPKNSAGEERFVTNTDYFLESGVVFGEIYNPMTFRVVLGGGIESRTDISPTLFIRGGLGRYFTRHLALLLDLSGRMIFRDKTAFPMEIGPSLQWIF